MTAQKKYFLRHKKILPPQKICELALLHLTFLVSFRCLFGPFSVYSYPLLQFKLIKTKKLNLQLNEASFSWQSLIII